MAHRSKASSPTKRIITELAAFHASPPSPLHTGILALSPSSPSSVLHLSAILSAPSSCPPSLGYAGGRWLVALTIPATYPVAAPSVRFVTRIVHPNVQWETGEVCLDVLGARWTPVLGVVGVLECVGRLLGEGGVESPLGVEVAALLRGGDQLGARSLVGYWAAEERFEGALEES